MYVLPTAKPTNAITTNNATPHPQKKTKKQSTPVLTQEQGHGRAGRLGAGAKSGGTATGRARTGDGTNNNNRRALQRGWTTNPEGAGGDVGNHGRAEPGGGRWRNSAPGSEQAGLALNQQAAALGLYA